MFGHSSCSERREKKVKDKIIAATTSAAFYSDSKSDHGIWKHSNQPFRSASTTGNAEVSDGVRMSNFLDAQSSYQSSSSCEIESSSECTNFMALCKDKGTTDAKFRPPQHANGGIKKRQRPLLTLVWNFSQAMPVRRIKRS